MGIDLEIRKYILERYPSVCSQEPIARRAGEQWVEIEDVLTRLHSLLGPTYNYMFTGDELCEAILEPAMRLFCLPSGHVRTYVLCADEPSRVPVEKAAEQKRRLEPDRATRRHNALDPDAAAAESTKKRRRPAAEAVVNTASTWKDRKKCERAGLERVYPSDAVVVAGGIRYQARQLDGTPSGEIIEEPLHLPSLLRERHARTSIWKYLQEYLSAANPMASLPGELIIDHWVDGPRRYAADALDGEVLRHLRHPFGEGELMCMFWANYYAKYSRVIHSIDTDVMPLTVHMLTISDVVDSGKLLWKYNARVHMDMKKLTDVLYRREQIVGHDFLVWCITGGADYYQKANAFAKIGCARILEIVKTAGPGTVKFVVPAGANALYRPENEARRFREFVLRGRGEPVEASEAAHRKKSCPTDSQIATAFKEFQFLYKYWSVNWNQQPRLIESAAAASTFT